MNVVLRFQSTGSIPGSGAPVRLVGPSLTIGRGAENDLVLPDENRMLSKRHCAIEDHNGNIIVVDFSTNGTFLNYGKLPLGPVPTPLNDGDILSLGPYELLVSITSDQPVAGIADALEDGPVSHGYAGATPSASDLLDAPGDGSDFLDDLLGGREAPVGPAGMKRDDIGEDGLLPPLGQDDPLLPPGPDEPWGGPAQGGSQRDHSAASQDHYVMPRAQTTPAVIPDDWEDDLLPKPGRVADAADPFANPFAGGSGGNSVFIPDDFDLGDTVPPEADFPAEPGLPPNAPFLPEPEETAPAPRPIPAGTPLPQRETVPAAPDAAPAPAPQPASGAPAADDAAARAFLKSLGADDVPVLQEDLAPTLSRLGKVLRIMVEGMREILMTRTSIKSEFRIEQTMIQAGGNNPLKFSVTPDQAIEALVRPSAKGYLEATEAAHQALRDIKAHEIAMVTGMESALKGVLKRLDPAVLEDRIKTGSGFSSVLKSRKARYWEVYEAMYAEIADQAENDFHDLFAREFARAYKDQLDKLK